jgi:Zn-dependent metalloprotease
MKNHLPTILLVLCIVHSIHTSAQEYNYPKTNFNQSFFSNKALLIDTAYGFVYFKKDSVKLNGFINEYKQLAGISAIEDLIAVDTLIDNLPLLEEEACQTPTMKHIRYQHTYSGYSLESSSLIVHADENNNVWYIQDNLEDVTTLSLSIVYDAQAAMNSAKNNLNIITLLTDSAPQSQPINEICFVRHPTTKQFMIANKIIFTSLNPFMPYEAYVNAETNTLIKYNELAWGGGIVSTFHHDNYGQNIGGLRTFQSNGKNYLVAVHSNDESYIHTSDLKYHHNLENRDWSFRNMPQEEKPMDRFWAHDRWSATNSHYCAQFAWDYFYYTYAQYGWDNNNKIVYISSDFIVPNTTGERFTGFYRMRNNEGYITISRADNNRLYATYDVLGHEYTHGIQEFNCLQKPVNSKIEGSAAESFADIFGVMVERWAKLGTYNWLLGEDAQMTRDMQNPNNSANPGSQPSHFNGSGWKNVSGCIPNDNNDMCWRYTNMGVMNRWFYILSNGGSETVNGQLRNMISGIGIDKAARIAFHAMKYNVYAINDFDNDFLRVRSATIASANVLFGMNSIETQAVCRAWHVVNTGTTCEVPPGVVVDWYKCTPLPNIVSVAPEINQLDKLKLYPNPSSQHIFIDLPETPGIKMSYKMFDVFGKLVLPITNIDSDKTTIDISQIANGVYFIETQCGSYTKILRVVVAH